MTRTMLERVSAVAEVTSNDDLVVLSLESPTCTPFHLMGGGVEIWLRLEDGPREVQSLIDEIADAHAIDRAGIEETVLDFLDDLVTAQLVRRFPHQPEAESQPEA